MINIKKEDNEKEVRGQTIRIYPTDIQIQYFNLCIKHNTEMYNYLVDYWNCPRCSNRKSISYYKLSEELKNINFQDKDKFPQCIEETCAKRFYDATQRYYEKLSRAPKKHKFNEYKQSFTLRLKTKTKHNIKNKITSFENKNNKYYFRMIWGNSFGRKVSNNHGLVLMAEELKFPYNNFQAKTVTIFNKANNWYASFQVEIEPIKEDNKYIGHIIDKVGIDLGINTYGMCYNSNNEVIKINWPDKIVKECKKLDNKIKDYQNILKPKIKGSKEYNLYKIKIQKCYDRKQNLKEDFLKKEARKLCLKYKVINLEKLDILPMIKRGKRINKGLRRSIYAQKWGFFIRFIQHKAKQFGTIVNFCKEKFASTKICSNCGNEKFMTLNDRIYECNSCGYIQDRDINAAINIFNYV